MRVQGGEIRCAKIIISTWYNSIIDIIVLVIGYHLKLHPERDSNNCGDIKDYQKGDIFDGDAVPGGCDHAVLVVGWVNRSEAYWVTAEIPKICLILFDTS